MQTLSATTSAIALQAVLAYWATLPPLKVEQLCLPENDPRVLQVIRSADEMKAHGLELAFLSARFPATSWIIFN